MLLAGLLGTALTQGLIAYTATLAPPEQRGRLVGVVQGGVFIGLLLARVVSGAVAATVGWRAVYLLSAALMAALAVLLWRRLPACRCAVPPRWRELLGSMLGMLPGRAARAWAAGIAAVCWPQRVLGGGAAAVVGAAVAVVHRGHRRTGPGRRSGRLDGGAGRHWMDRGFAGRVSLGALLLMLAAWWPLLGLPQALSLLLLGVIVLDLGGQARTYRTRRCCCVHRQNSMDAWWRCTCCSMQWAVVPVRLPGPGCRPAWLACRVPAGCRHRGAGAVVVGSMAGGGVQCIGWRANR